jgi:hypothetical protein
MRDTVLLNLHLVNFKNHSELELAFSPGLNAFVGVNSWWVTGLPSLYVRPVCSVSRPLDCHGD